MGFVRSLREAQRYRWRETLKLLAGLPTYRRLLQIARGEIDHWLAASDEDPNVGAVAAGKIHRERRNVESAVFFAMLAPSHMRVLVTRRIVRFELVYELLDELNEQAPEFAEGLRLQAALIDAVGGPASDAQGYVARLVAACRQITTLSDPMLWGVKRIGEAQARNHARHGLRGWAAGQSGELQWWEQAAAGISSLDVLAMFATPASEHGQIAATYTETRALSGLLDALIDLPSDRSTGNHNWLQYYPSAAEVEERLAVLARRAHGRMGSLPGAATHRALLAGLMAHNLVHQPDLEQLAAAVPHTRAAMRILR